MKKRTLTLIASPSWYRKKEWDENLRNVQSNDKQFQQLIVSNKIPVNGLNGLKEALLQNRTLTEVNISNNNLQDNDIETIFSVLHSSGNTSLRILDIRYHSEHQFKLFLII